MSKRSLTREEILAALAQTAPRIAVLTAGLAAARLAAVPHRGEWSVRDVLAHLRACADVWGDCIAAIVAYDKPVLRAINPRSWIRNTDYLEQAFRPSLQAFSRQRADLLALLNPLPGGAWSRKAAITGAGNVLEKTVHDYALRLTVHERPHLQQIRRIVTDLR